VTGFQLEYHDILGARTGTEPKKITYALREHGVRDGLFFAGGEGDTAHLCEGYSCKALALASLGIGKVYGGGGLTVLGFAVPPERTVVLVPDRERPDLLRLRRRLQPRSTQARPETGQVSGMPWRQHPLTHDRRAGSAGRGRSRRRGEGRPVRLLQHAILTRRRAGRDRRQSLPLRRCLRWEIRRRIGRAGTVLMALAHPYCARVLRARKRQSRPDSYALARTRSAH
jgi:hypothetical protein